MSNPVISDDQTHCPSLASAVGETRDIIEQLRDFLEIDDMTKQYARVLLALFTGCGDEIIIDFYGKIQKSVIGPYVTDDAVARLISKQKAHWVALFNSDFGRDYLLSVRRIGIQHRDIALNPLWYVAGYTKLKLSMIERIAALDVSQDKKSSLVTALEKYVAMDMALALATYHSVIVD
jgi:hypothetical protein